MNRATTAFSALAGVAAAALGLGLEEAIAGLFSGATSLIDAIGQVVIALQPPGAKDFMVGLFGTNDKLALEIVVVVAALAFGAALGIVGARRPMAATIGFGIFGVLGFFAGIGQPLASAPFVAIQAAVATWAAIQALSWLLGRLGITAESGDEEPVIPDPARRSFLLRTTAVGIGAVAFGVFGRSAIESGRTSPTPSVPLPAPQQTVPPLDATADLSTTVPSLTPLVVPNESFYRIDTSLLVPSLGTADWKLRVHGLVERETELDWQQLISMPMFEQYVTIACVSNEVGGHLVGNARWTGVRLRDVLAMAEPTSAATQLVGRSVDGWTAGMPMDWVMDPSREPMIAVEMNGEPLPRSHGFPARLIVPGLYGYVSATKWLTELELTTWEAFDGYWVPLGWSKKGPILTQSRIDTPRGSVAAGRVPIGGIAWAPDRGVSKVEVGIDDTWYEARIWSPISKTTWVQWLHPWDATPGQHTISVRATDGNGVLQDEIPSRPAPDGARGWHTISVSVS